MTLYDMITFAKATRQKFRNALDHEYSHGASRDDIDDEVGLRGGGGKSEARRVSLAQNVRVCAQHEREERNR